MAIFPKMVQSFTFYLGYLNFIHNNEETGHSFLVFCVFSTIQTTQSLKKANVNEQAGTQTLFADKNYSQAQGFCLTCYWSSWLQKCHAHYAFIQQFFFGGGGINTCLHCFF